MGINLDKQVSLAKYAKSQAAENVVNSLDGKVDKAEQEKIKVLLQKQQAEVVFVIDRSGSMTSHYNDGSLNALVEKCVATGLTFDDDGTMPVIVFSDYAKWAKDLNPNNYTDYVDVVINGKQPVSANQGKSSFFGKMFGGGNTTTNSGGESYDYGTTVYSKAIIEITKKFGEISRELPVFVIFTTDGDCNSDDRQKTRQALIDASKFGIFFQFVGVGYKGSFGFLESLDTLTVKVGDPNFRQIDNAGFVSFGNFKQFADPNLEKTIYDGLMNEFPAFCLEARKRKMIK